MLWESHSSTNFPQNSSSLYFCVLNYAHQNLPFCAIGPWGHLFLGGAGAFVGANYSNWEKSLLDDLNAKRKEKGLAEITRQDLTVFNK